MTQIDKANEGKRVELVHTNDPYTKLKPGDRGTYEFLLRQTPPMQNQHCIKWDSGSTLSLLEGIDRFTFMVWWQKFDKYLGEKDYRRGEREFTCPICGEKIHFSSFIAIGYYEIAVKKHLEECGVREGHTPNKDKEGNLRSD